MKFSRWLIAGALLLALLPSEAFAQKSKSAMTSEIGQNLPDNSTGQITPFAVRSTLTDMVNSWQQYTGVNAQLGTSYTFQLSDYGQLVTFNNASAISATLPQAAGSFATFNSYASNVGVGLVTISPQGGSTINGQSSLTLANGQSVQIVSDGSNYQIFNGSPSGAATTDIFKSPARVATTGSNITLSGTQTIDGVSVVAGDRVLVKDQSTASQNGIYVVASGSWSRSSDWSATGQVVQGTQVFVTSGTINKLVTFEVTTAGTITIGTTNVAISGETSATQYDLAGASGSFVAGPTTAVGSGPGQTLAVNWAWGTSAALTALYAEAGLWSGPVYVGQGLSKIFDSSFSSGATSPVATQYIFAKNTGATSDVVAQLVSADAAANNTHTFAANDLVRSESGCVSCTLSIREFDMIPAAGTTLGAGSIGLPINMWSITGGTAVQLGSGDGIGKWANGYNCGVGVASSGTCLGAGAGTMDSLWNSANSAYTSAAGILANTHKIRFSGTASAHAYIYNDSGNILHIVSGSSGVALRNNADSVSGWFYDGVGTTTFGQAGSLQGAIGIEGATSGRVTQTSQAVAGTPTVTWGTSSGTPAVTASGLLAINTTTGNITCANCATTANGAPFVKINIQKFTSGGTYTPTTGLSYAVIECLGGGGGGGGVAGGTSTITAGGGGASGSYSKKNVTAATVGVSQTVTIGAAGTAGSAGNNTGGAGGTSSVGSICTAPGGSGGAGAPSGVGGAGGAPGASGTGDTAVSGSPGGTGIGGAITSIAAVSGMGASSLFGGGAASVSSVFGSATAGNAAANYGGGGSGAVASNVASNAAGGAGSAGYVVITEYLTQ